tara:strand:- start:4435 stop:4839 length:405 start_codon:yes stop_codon:yes gene_type:complete
MGVENPEIVQILASFFATLLGVFWSACFIQGLIREGVPNLNQEVEVDDQDLFAAATGDEEYLMAHFVLKEDDKPEVKTPVKKVKPHKTKDGQEAVSGLVSLGYKRAEANRLVDDILTCNPTLTPEQVVLEVLQK